MLFKVMIFYNIFQELKSRIGKEPPKSSSGIFCAQLSFFLHSLFILSYCISHLLQMFNLQHIDSNSRSNVDDTIKGEEGTDHLYLGNFYLFYQVYCIFIGAEFG